MMKEKKLPDVINKVIKKVGVYDKKIEFEGSPIPNPQSPLYII